MSSKLSEIKQRLKGIEPTLAADLRTLCSFYGVPNELIKPAASSNDYITEDAEFEIIEPKQLPPNEA